MMPRLPASLLGIVLLAYWGRVLRLAWKARRATGRAANLVPPEPLGRILRLIWAPAITAWIAQPLIVAFVSRPPALVRPLYFNPWIAWIALFVASVALAVTWMCWKQMGRAWRMGIDPGERTALIVAGPFARVRHPIYALSHILMLASVAALPSPLLIAAAVVHIALLQWEARREERHQLALHGEQYEQYCARVGRFIPRRARSQ
jgi:protein-S-isoprenylcysteine O-methyltransferase Ste14